MSDRWNRFKEKFRRQPPQNKGKTWKNQPVGTKVTKEFAAPRPGLLLEEPPQRRRRRKRGNMRRSEHFIGRRDPWNKETRKKINRRRAKNKMGRKTRQRQRNMNRTAH